MPTFFFSFCGVAFIVLLEIFDRQALERSTGKALKSTSSLAPLPLGLEREASRISAQFTAHTAHRFLLHQQTIKVVARMTLPLRPCRLVKYASQTTE